MHRDIKAVNILLADKNKPMIGDFGVSEKSEPKDENKKGYRVGTLQYMAPEIMNSKPYSYKSDIWSLGIVLYELLALKKPFEIKDKDANYKPGDRKLAND